MNTGNHLNKRLRGIVDNRDESTLAASFRQKRFALFLSLIKPLPKPINILDVGGEQRFWKVMGVDQNSDLHITLLNTYQPTATLPNFIGIRGNAIDMGEFKDEEFDFVFSNSVIEHLENFENQERMAEEIQRVGKNYFVQTPNKYFPIEPHFLVPFFQFFPQALQIALLRRFNLGWYPRVPDLEQATLLVSEHRLLTEKEIRKLFPGGALYKERAFGLTKSFIAYSPGG